MVDLVLFGGTDVELASSLSLAKRASYVRGSHRVAVRVRVDRKVVDDGMNAISAVVETTVISIAGLALKAGQGIAILILLA